MGVKVGELFAELKLDKSHFDRGVKAGEGLFKNLAKVAVAAFAAIAAGLVAIGVASVRAAEKFETSMALIQTQAGGSAKEVKDMSSAILKLAPQVGTGPDALAQSLYHIESAGMRGAKGLDLLKTAALGAKVGNADLETVTNALIAEVRSGISGVTTYAQAMGVLNGIVGAGNMRMGDLSAAMGSGFLSVAKQFGVSIQSVGAALAAMTDQGIPAEDAATKLKMAIVKLGAPSGKGVKILKDLGLGPLDLANAMRGSEGLQGAVKLLRKHLDESGLSASAQAKAIADAFGGGKVGPAVMALLGAADSMDGKFKQIAGSAGGFGAAVETTMETAKFHSDRVAASMEAIAVTIGNTLLPIADSVLGTISDILASEGFQNGVAQFGAGLAWVGTTILPMVGAAFQSFVGAVRPMLAAAFQAVAAAGPQISAALGAVGAAIGSVVSFVRGFLSDASNFRGALVALAAVVGTIVVSALAGMATAAWAAVAPFVPIAAAAFAAYKILEHFGLIKPIMDGLGKAIGAVSSWLSKSVFPFLSAAVGAAFKMIGGYLDVGATAFQAVGGVIDKVVKSIFGSWSGLATFMGNVWRGINNAVKGGINILIDMVNGLIDALNSLQIHIDLGPAGKIDFNGLNLGKVGRLAMDVGTPLGSGQKVVSGSPDDPAAARAEWAARHPNAGKPLGKPAPGDTGAPPPILPPDLSGLNTLGGAGAAAKKVSQAVKDAMAAAKDAASRAYDQMKDKAHAYFEAVHNATLKSVADARDAANAILDAKERELTGSLSAARAAVKAERDARQLASLQAAVASAQTPEEQAAAQQALADFQKDQALEAMQATVDAQVAEIEAQKKANDDKAAAAVEDENKRYAAQVKSFDDQFALLKENLEKGRVTYKDANEQIVALLSGFGVDYATAGELLGAAFAKGLEDQVKLVEAAAKKLAAAAKKAGVKNILSQSSTGGPQPGLAPGVSQTGITAADLAPFAAAGGQAPMAAATVTGGQAGSVTIGTINMPVQTSNDPKQFVQESLLELKRQLVRQGMSLA